MRDTLPAPGFAHAIHNRLTHLPELHHWLHGEKASYSLPVQSFMEQPNGEPDAARLPFEVSPAALEKALIATDYFS